MADWRAAAPIGQLAEPMVSNTIQCGFESHSGHARSFLRLSVMASRRAAAGALALTFAVAACSGVEAERESNRSEPRLAAEIVQLRRDVPLERIQVSLNNIGAGEVVVERLLVRVPGFVAGAGVRKDSSIPPGQVVNLPWSYGTVRCDAADRPSVGRPVVRLRVHTGIDPTPHDVRLVAQDPSGLLTRIAVRACTVRGIAREVDLRFGSRWRRERRQTGVVLHGTLEARLLIGRPRNVTQLAGAIMYGLQVDEPTGEPSVPLAALTRAQPRATIPVTFFAARCDGHTIGEIKKPYEFLAWVAAPGGEEFAVTPQLDQGTKDALQEVCAF